MRRRRRAARRSCGRSRPDSSSPIRCKPQTIAKSIAIGNPADGFQVLRSVRATGGGGAWSPTRRSIDGHPAARRDRRHLHRAGRRRHRRGDEEADRARRPAAGRIDRDLHHRQRLQDHRGAERHGRASPVRIGRSLADFEASAGGGGGAPAGADIMSSYHAVFRCAAGCPGDLSIWQPIYHCPTCGGLLQVVHDLDALARSQRRGLDAARSTSATSGRPGRTARACGARRNGSARSSATSTSCRWTRAAPTCSGPSASAASSGSTTSGSSSAATRTPARSRTSA